MIQTKVKRSLLYEVLTNRLTAIVSFALLTAVSAQIAVPVSPVPFTFQTVAVVLAGAFLGAKDGALSQLLYLAMGALGFPVFANGSLGLMALLGPTGGYLLAFPLAAYLTGFMLKGSKSYLLVSLSILLANVLIIALGTLFLYTFYLHNAKEALLAGAGIFTVWTAVKIFITVNIFYFINKPRKAE
jgi:biotin transport system substrate-specific component